MTIFANILIGVGALGLFESTIGGVGFAWLYKKVADGFIRASKKKRNLHNTVTSIDLLVVAHNEESLISQSLSSLLRAKENFLFEHSAQVKIHLGIDHCSDQTESVARKWAIEKNTDLEILQNPGARGKWNVLQQLIIGSEAEWVALVDVGAIWADGLLNASMPLLSDPEVIGVAPSYRPVRSGLFEKLNWRLERFLKVIESEAGGPVSVHGATVLYRRRYLLRVLHELSLQSWLNDDVVIPLALRTRWPNLKIAYLSKTGRSAWVRDEGVKAPSGIEYGRRKRIMLGNLQWIRALYFKALSTDFKVGIIASRRVFRTFWAYWVLSILLGFYLHGLALFPTPYLALGLGFIAILAATKIPLAGGARRLRSAFLAGLETPFHLLHTKKTSEKIWN